MSRLTEYHNGVAVIKGKRYKEAAEKLASYENGFELICSDIEFYKRLLDKCDDENRRSIQGLLNGMYRAKRNLLLGGGSDE